MPKRTARRSMSYKGCNKKTSMSTVLVNIRLIKIKAIMMVAPIRSAASTLGRGRLGYDPESFATHSIRIGAAMVIHLGGCATFIIMILCRWKVAASMGASENKSLNSVKGYLSECSSPVVDIDFLLKEVDAIYITITNFGLEAPRLFDEMPRLSFWLRKETDPRLIPLAVSCTNRL
jgi:hypothetical protein